MPKAEADMAGFEGGTRFPFINLEKALARAEELYSADQRGNEMPISGAFGVWKYSDKSSGGFQTVAALKMYGLLEDAGTKESRKVKLTKHALDYFRDEREEVRSGKLLDFATNPTLFHALFNSHWGANIPDDAVARSTLKVDGELNEQSARTALGIYKENIAYAKVTGRDKPLEIEPKDGKNDVPPLAAVKVGDFVQWSPGGIDQLKTPRPIVWIADDGSHVRVRGETTGMPVSELTVHPAPKAALPSGAVTANSAFRADNPETKSEVSVLLRGKRLEITADVDAAGLGRLQEILTKYAEILKLVN